MFMMFSLDSVQEKIY